VRALTAAADTPTSGTSTLRRYREVAAVLVTHGLADLVDALHLRRYLAWGAWALPRELRTEGSRAARVRRALEALGPTFVKFGQALSVRADLLPPDLVAELSKLQEHVAPLDPGVAEAAIEAELGRPVAELYAAFEPTPIAAASIAQVHRAVLPTGAAVAVKVRRPGIGRTIAADIEMLRQLARLVERRIPGADIVDPPGLVEEFARTIRAEQDLVREARNIERCAANFAGDPTVRLPRVDWERTSPGVLTMELLEGTRLAELDTIDAGPFVRQLIARRGADAVLAQVLVHGFFHADPHPGNIVILPDHVIGFIDFGIVGRLDESTRHDLGRIIRAVWQRDAAGLAAIVLDVTEARTEVDARGLTHDLSALIELYGNVPIGDLSATEVLGDVVSVAARYRLRVPSNLMLLIKTLVTIEGVGAQLDPAFKMVEHAAPLAERLWRGGLTPQAVGRRVVHTLEQTFNAARAVPVHLDAIGRKIRDGRLEIRFVHRNLEHFVREMDRSSNRLAFALIIAALIVGSSLVIHADRGASVYGYPVLGLAGFVIAALFGFRLAIGIFRSGRL
jgi:ubiquinone biosynthesis protein